MPDPSHLPARIDRAAVDRVLARALELQASGSPDAQAEQLTETQLLELAKEVGLDPTNLRQALAEERTRVALPEERGLLASLFGGASASAQRTVSGTPAQVLKALDDWMQRQECLAVQRYHGSERIVWESRRGLAEALRRRISARGQALARASDVSATAIAMENGRVLVRLDARLHGYRAMMANQGAAFTGAGLVAGGIVAVLSPFLLAAAVPVAVLAPVGFATGRASHRRTMDRAQLALEQVLDRLERGEAGRPPTLLSMLAAAVKGH
jgi:hypothetical protein